MPENSTCFALLSDGNRAERVGDRLPGNGGGPRSVHRCQLPPARFQPFVPDVSSSSTNGWEFQPFVADERASSTNGWEFQPFLPDDGSSSTNGCRALAEKAPAPPRAHPAQFEVVDAGVPLPDTLDAPVTRTPTNLDLEGA
jgi:hypothetical protein